MEMLLWIFWDSTGKAEIIFNSFRSPLEVYLTMTTSTSEKPGMWKGSIKKLKQKTEIIKKRMQQLWTAIFKNVCIHFVHSSAKYTEYPYSNIKKWFNLVPWKHSFFHIIPQKMCCTGQSDQYWQFQPVLLFSECKMHQWTDCGRSVGMPSEDHLIVTEKIPFW